MKINRLFSILMVGILLNSCSQSIYPVTRNITLAEVNPEAFRFEATNAIPSRGNTKILDGLNDLMVRNDTLSAQLPYIGVSQSAPIPGTEETGIRFITTRYQLSTQSSSDRMTITIEVEDQRFIRTMVLVIQQNGSAKLDVLSNFRDPITFSGRMTTIPTNR